MPTCLQGAYALCAKPVAACLAVLGICACLSPALAQTSVAPLTLAAAIAQTLATAPAMEEAASLEKAARADLTQARRWQNPELGLDAENILGSGDYKGTKSAEITLGLSQSVELPAKRKHRLAAIAGTAELGHQQADAVRIDTIYAVTVAFLEAAIVQQNARLMLAQLDIAEAQYKSVAAKVSAGKEPPLQEHKARIDVANARMTSQQAQQKAKTAKEQLQILTGIASISQLDISSLGEIEEPLPLAEYATRAALSPAMRAAMSEATTAQARASYAGVEWLPDPSLTLGLRELREDDSRALILGVSMPIPLADRNKAGALAAHERANAATAAERKTRQTLGSEILRLHAELTTAYQTLNNYNTQILPAATTAADLARRGYEAGKLQYIDMLDAGRTLTDARQSENEALLSYHLRKAELEKLAGRHDHHATEAHQ